MKVCYIVLTYNNSINTIKTLTDILNQNQDQSVIDILCIDNNSQQKYAAEVLSYCTAKQIRYVYHNENDGYAGGNNYAFSLIRNQFYDFLFFVNNDVLIPDANLTSKILSAFRSDHKLGILGPRVCDAVLNEVAESMLSRVVSKFVLCQKNNYLINKMYNNRSSVIGCFLAIRSECLLDNSELFPRCFFMYSEEVFLCNSIIQKGWGVGVINDPSCIIHLGGSSPFGHCVPWQLYLLARNTVLCARNFKNGLRIFLYVNVYWWSVIKTCLMSYISIKNKIALLKGFMCGLFFLILNSSDETLYDNARTEILKSNIVKVN